MTDRTPLTYEERVQRGRWVPACGGTEKPFRTRTGRRLLYCWHTQTGDHAYLDCDTDIILTAEEAANALALH
jgi:hypothetical protein